MKKRTLIERKKALKEAYYKELQKRGVLNNTRKNLLAEAKELGLTGYGKLKNDELKKVIEDKKAELKAIEEEKQKELPADGTIEDIDIPDITETQVQAVANAIVEQAEGDNKTIDQVVNEIVEESEEDGK